MTIFCGVRGFSHYRQRHRTDRHAEHSVARQFGKQHQKARTPRARCRTAAPSAVEPPGGERGPRCAASWRRDPPHHWLSAPDAPAPSAIARIDAKPSTGGTARRGKQPAQRGKTTSDDAALSANRSCQSAEAPFRRGSGFAPCYFSGRTGAPAGCQQAIPVRRYAAVVELVERRRVDRSIPASLPLRPTDYR